LAHRLTNTPNIQLRAGLTEPGIDVVPRRTRRFHAWIFAVDRCRFITADLLVPSPATRLSQSGTPRRFCPVSLGWLEGREAERFGMGSAVVLGEDFIDLAGVRQCGGRSGSA